MTNILEIIMIITTIIYSYFMLYCKRSGFIFGVIAAGIMGYILVSTGVFVQAILNFIYAVTYIYSYFMWGSEKKSPVITRITAKQLIALSTYILIFTLFMGYAFSDIGGAYPYVDSFSAACSTAAVFLLSQKIIENSHIFVLSNIASIIICYMSKDYITILTFLIYMIFNIMRAYTWKKELNQEK